MKPEKITAEYLYQKCEKYRALTKRQFEEINRLNREIERLQGEICNCTFEGKRLTAEQARQIAGFIDDQFRREFEMSVRDMNMRELFKKYRRK